MTAQFSSNGSTTLSSNELHPVTKLFAEFIANAEPSILSPTLISRLKEYLLDYLGVTIAASHEWESTEQIVQGIVALGARNGSSTVPLKGSNFLPQYAGLLNATFGHTMDFDDTYALGTLHAGTCAWPAALTQAELLGNEGATSKQFLLVAAVGYEIICRLGGKLRNDAYERGFHNTATAGIFGAVAAISVLKRLSASTIETAFGLALSKAAGSMQYLENGSWNKRIHPGFAVHDAFVCVSLAEAGVVGAARSIEGKYGFLHSYTPRTGHDLLSLTADLGVRWDFLDTALKPYPACRMTHGLIEVGGSIGLQNKGREVKKMTISLSSPNYIVVGSRISNKLYPNNIVDAQFSAYFQLAHAWLYGPEPGVEFAKRLKDESIRILSDKIECIIDDTVKSMGSKLHIEYEDGESHDVDIPFPLGEPEHPFNREQAEAKYLSLVVPVFGKEKAQEIKALVEELEEGLAVKLLHMIA
ncbi:hypothetical protein Neosp_014796 [[Neocosmospora] mangrovei]